MFNFSPLQGALSESPATQSLLELDGNVKVLVGLGWDESFDPQKLKELEKQVQSQTISLVLLTHATVGHLAAFAHLCKNIPRFTHIPVYATRPVCDLGRSLLQDLYDSTPRASSTVPETSLAEAALAFNHKPSVGGNSSHDFLLQGPTQAELARYFSLIQPLKYSQPHQPLPTPGTPPLNGLTITAYNSGRTLGGTIWHIQHGLESIVYAVDWNLARENVFSGAAWLGGAGGGGAEVIEQLRKPTALVCSARTSTQPPGGRAKRDDSLIDAVRACVARGGTALIPVDSSARVLELAYVLEHAWRKDARSNGGLAGAKLYLAGRSMGGTIRYARTMLEWMDDNINKEFEAVQDNLRRGGGAGPGTEDARGKDGGPFDFKYAKVLERKAQVAKLLAQSTDSNAQTGGGRVILASDTSLEWGFSRDLLKGLARDSRNVLILTEKPGAGVVSDRPTLAGQLWELWSERRDGVSTERGPGGEDIEFVYGGGRELEIREDRREALEGEDLALYQQYLAQRQLQENIQSGGSGGAGVGGMEGGGAGADDDEASSESSLESEDEDSEQQGRVLNIAATMGPARKAVRDEDLGVNILVKKKAAYDYAVDARRGRDRMFPLAVRRKRADEFGEVIRPEEYLRAEEKHDADAQQDQQRNGLLSGGGFPGEEEGKVGRKRKWDDSGPGRKGGNKRPFAGRAAAEDAAQQPAKEEVDELDEVEDEEEPDVSGPARLVSSVEVVPVNMRLAYVDFSGMHDRRSLNMLIPLIQPRKLILVGGSAEETASLAESCRALLAPQQVQRRRGSGQPEGVEEAFVFTPAVGEVVNASVDTNAWTVKLSDELVKKLKWQSVKGLSIVTLTGSLLALPVPSTSTSTPPHSQEDASNKRQKPNPEDPTTTTITTTNDDNERETAPKTLLPTLTNPPQSTVVTHTPAAALHVGDLRLADLRREMQAAGHAAEFRGEGTLLVDGLVMVRKEAAGRVEVRGAVGEGAGMAGRAGAAMVQVRRAIYKNLAVVGA